MKFWNWLNGKKRTIGIMCIIIAHMPHLVELTSLQFVDILLYFGMSLAGVGAVHAVIKDVVN